MLRAQSARAEGGALPCRAAAQVRPASYQQVPANAPALVFYPTDAPTYRTPDNHDLRLFGPDWVERATAIEVEGAALLVRPREPLVPGEYRLRYREFCTGAWVDGRVVVGPAAPLPTSIGPVRAARPERRNACRPDDVFVAMEILGPPELLAFAAVLRFTVEVDGVSTVRRYGDLIWQNDSPPTLLAGPFTAVCPPGHTTAQNHVRITAHLAGSSYDVPPFDGHVVTACPPPITPCPDGGGSSPAPSSSPDGGVVAPDSRSMDASSWLERDASGKARADAAEPASGPKHDHDGCTYAPRRSSANRKGMVASFALLSGVLALARRRINRAEQRGEVVQHRVGPADG